MRRISIIVIALVLLLVLLLSMFIVDQKEQAVITQFGEPVRVIVNPIAEGRERDRILNELKTKYGVTVVKSPDEILEKLLDAWDKVADAEAAKNPRFAKIYESQRDWASKIVPYRGIFFKDYSFTADHYWK